MDSAHFDLEPMTEVTVTDTILEHPDLGNDISDPVCIAISLPEEQVILSGDDASQCEILHEDAFSTDTVEVHVSKTLSEGVMVDEAMVEIGGEPLQIDEGSAVFMPAPMEFAEAQKSGHLKPRVIQLGLRKKWQEKLQKKNNIICPVPGCQMKFFTLFSFERHYRWCTGEKGEGVERCIYCEGQYLSSDWGIFDHVSQDHPEKLREYKNAKRAAFRKKVANKKKEVVVYMNNSGNVDKVVSTEGETVSVVSAIPTTTIVEGKDGTVDDVQPKTCYTTKQFKIRKVDPNKEKKVKFKSKVTMYPINKIKKRRAMRDGKMKLLIKPEKPDSDDEPDEILPCLRKFPGTLSITQSPQGINVFSPKKKKMLGLVIEPTRNWSAPRRTYARNASTSLEGAGGREENWLLIAGTMKSDLPTPEPVPEQLLPEPPAPFLLPPELILLQDEEDKFQLKKTPRRRDTNLEFFRPPEEEEEEEEQKEEMKKEEEDEEVMAERRLAQEKMREQRRARRNTDQIAESNVVTIVIENRSKTQSGETQVEELKLQEIEQPEAPAQLTDKDEEEETVVEKTRRGLSEINRKTSDGEEIIVKKKGRVVFCMRNHRQFVKNIIEEPASPESIDKNEMPKKPMKTYSRQKSKDIETQTDLEPIVPADTCISNGISEPVLNKEQELSRPRDYSKTLVSADSNAVLESNDLNEHSFISKEATDCNHSTAPSSSVATKPSNSTNNSDIVEGLMEEILNVIFSDQPSDVDTRDVRAGEMRTETSERPEIESVTGTNTRDVRAGEMRTENRERPEIENIGISNSNQMPANVNQNSLEATSPRCYIVQVVTEDKVDSVVQNKRPYKRKIKTGEVQNKSLVDANKEQVVTPNSEQESPPVKKKRGRKKKIVEADPVVAVEGEKTGEIVQEIPPVPVKGKRGRKPKALLSASTLPITPVTPKIQDNPLATRRSSRKRKIPVDDSTTEALQAEKNQRDRNVILKPNLSTEVENIVEDIVDAIHTSLVEKDSNLSVAECWQQVTARRTTSNKDSSVPENSAELDVDKVVTSTPVTTSLEAKKRILVINATSALRDDGGDEHSLPLKKRRVETVTEAVPQVTPVRRRGRPRKIQVPPETTVDVPNSTLDVVDSGTGQNSERSQRSEKRKDLTPAEGNAKETPSSGRGRKKRLSEAELVCSACKETFKTRQKIRTHIVSRHNGLAKVNDDTPLTKVEKLEGIRYALKIRRSLTCPRQECRKVLRSFMGFYLHLESCGVEVELVTCDICGNKLKPNSFSVHMKNHKKRQEDEQRLQQEEETAKAEEGPSEPTSKRRQASVRANVRLQEFIKGQEVGTEERSKDKDEDYEVIEEKDPSVKKSPVFSRKYVKTRLKFWEGKFVEPQPLRTVSEELFEGWEKEIKGTGTVECDVQQDCGESFKSGEAMKQHWSRCGLQSFYKCLLCNFCGTEDVNSIWSHLTNSHGSEEIQSETAKTGETSAYRYCTAYINDDKTDFSLSKLECFKLASTWTRAFYEKHYVSEVFPDWRPRQEHWQRIENIEEYLPPYKESVNFKLSKQPGDNTWQNLKLFESWDIKNGTDQVIFNVGGPVWASDWCPEPLSAKGRQYVALDACLDPDRSHLFTKNEDERSLLQLWDFGLLRNKKIEEKPRLALAVALDYGVVWQMRWCPSGCFDDTDSAVTDCLPRLGLLALACGDGIVRILSIPHPEKVGNSDKTIPMFRTKPVIELIPPSSGSSCVTTWHPMCTSVSWQRTDGHKLLLSGYSNGMVCRWDLTTKSPLLIVDDAETPRRLNPSLVFFPHVNTPVLSVVWAAISEGRFFVTAGYDRTAKVWDTENMNSPFHEVKRGLYRDLSWCCYWNGFFGSVDECYNLGMSHTVYKEPGYYGYSHRPISSHNACTWAISISEWMNIEASADAAGEVALTVLCNMEQNGELHKKFPSRRMPVYRIELEPLEAVQSSEEGSREKPVVVSEPGSASDLQMNDLSTAEETNCVTSDANLVESVEADGCLVQPSNEERVQTPQNAVGVSLKENDLTVSLVSDGKQNSPAQTEFCRTYKEASQKLGLVFVDAPLRKMSSLSVAEHKRLSRSESMNFCVPNQYQLASVNTLTWSYNSVSSGWLFTAGQAGLARLSCLSAFQHSDVLKR